MKRNKSAGTGRSNDGFTTSPEFDDRWGSPAEGWRVSPPTRKTMREATSDVKHRDGGAPLHREAELVL